MSPASARRLLSTVPRGKSCYVSVVIGFLNCETSLEVWKTAVEYVSIVFPLLQSLSLCDLFNDTNFLKVFKCINLHRF